jgi:hypothetical protein
MNVLWFNVALLAGRSSGGGMGSFLVLVIIGIVVFLALRGRQDRAEALGTPVRPMASGPVAGHAFTNPFPKCPSCGAGGEKMNQAWDGLRKVTWTCAYCGSVAGIQELKDEELPPGARQRLGLDPPQGLAPGQSYPNQGGGMCMGGLVTGMMLGSMLGGERRERDDAGGWSGDGDDGSGGGDGGWSDSGGGDSGGGDF